MEEKESSDWKGVSLVLVGALLFSAKAVVVKLTYRYEITAIGSLFFRMFFAFPFLVWIAWKEESVPNKIKLTRKDWSSIILMGIVGYYLASLFDFLGLQYISAGLERIILFIYPTLVVVLSFLFLKKKITSREVFSLLLTYTGVGLAYGKDIQLGSPKDVSLGAFFILLSALTYAIYLMGSGSIVPRLGAKRFTAWSLIVSSIVVFLHFLILGNWKEVIQPPDFYALAFLMGTLNTVVPAVFVSAGIKRVGSKTAAIVGSIGPMSTLFLAYVFLDEPITVVHSLGTLLVLTGVFWISSAKKGKSDPE